MEIIKTGRQIGRTLKNASRLKTIVGVFVRHGFYNVAERIKLGRYVLDRISSSQDFEKLSVPERVRQSFEELGPTFVKLGQLLATRPDLVPENFVIEFGKLHDRVQSISFSAVEEVLRDEFGDELYTKFQSFDPEPLGSASIAQVHKAVLFDGTPVVVKVQRPGIKELIQDDIDILYLLAELIESYIPESRPFNPMAIVDEYFRTLELETNFVVEANNLRRFELNFKDDSSIKIPSVYWDLTTQRVLTMEALLGIPLTSPQALKQEGILPDEVIRSGLRVFMKMVFVDGLFHGDLHPGNFFLLPNNRIGLIDFGVVGRLNRKTQLSITNMLLALSKEDYEHFADEYIQLAPFNEEVNVDLFARDLRNLMAPYFGLTAKNINLGKILLSSSSIAAKYQLRVPSDLMLYFKAIVAVEGLGKRIQKDFDFLQYSLEFASDLLKAQYDPQKIADELFDVLKESKRLVSQLPKQLFFTIRKINSPNHAIKINVQQLSELKKSIEVSYNLLFLGIIIGSLLLSSSIISLAKQSESQMAGLPTLSFVGFVSALCLSVIAFLNYIKK